MKHVTKLQKNKDLIKLNILELLKMSDVVQSYLETHKLDMTRGNKIDINDRPFDKGAYKKQEQLMYSIWAELFSRPVDEGLGINV